MMRPSFRSPLPHCMPPLGLIDLQEAYQREREAMVRSSEALFRQRKRRETSGTGPRYVIT